MDNGREEAPRVLIVDDEPLICDLLTRILGGEGLHLETAASGEEALAMLQQRKYALVITDLKMPGMNGMDLLQEIKQKHPEMPVIVITGYGTAETAVEAMRRGANDFIAKPFPELEQVISRVRRTLSISQASP